MIKKKISACLITTLCFLFGLNINQAFAFSDVSSKLSQYKAITTLEEQGIISGYPDGTFHPNEAITRSQLLKMTFAHIGYKPEDKEPELKFNDVPPGSWFAPYVAKALELGSINYDSKNPYFFPDQPITKIEALKMVLPLEGIAAAQYLNDKTSTGYKDINDKSSYAYLVRAAKNAKLFHENKKTNNFSPFKILTRAEAAELLYNAGIYRSTLQSGTPPSYESSNLNGLSDTELEILNNPKFPVFVSVWKKINQKYYNPGKVNQNEMVYGAIEGMVNNLGDQYSIFESPQKAGALQDSLEGKFDGIGTVISLTKNQFVVESVLDESPAQKAGIKINDIITKVDNVDVKGLTSEKVVNMIKGTAGTKVKLTILRDGKTMEFNMVRESLKINSLYKPPNTAVVPNNIGYISIHQFTSTTPQEFETVLKKTMESKPKGIILDLRDNPGGYLDSAYQVMDHFIPKDLSIMKLKYNGRLIDEKSEGPGELNKMPIIILVNKYSASAAEVLAGAMQDYKYAKLVGEQTYGKGTVQEVTTFSDGSLLKLSIANWLTPLGRSIDKVGLTPDYVVEISKADESKNIDTQLNKAVELLK